MADAGTIREIVERVVVEVFDSEMGRVREEVVGRTIEAVQPLFAPPAEGTPTKRLKAAVEAVEDATAQSDILRVLLDGAALFSGRAALFIVRGQSAVGWQARGFRENDAIKLLTLDLNMGLAGRAFQQRACVNGLTTQFEPRFVTGFGAPSNGECMVLPLVIRDKVAALIYADAGTNLSGVLDCSALELLAGTAGRWLEILALRKTAGASIAQPAINAAQVQAVSPVTHTVATPAWATAGAKVPASVVQDIPAPTIAVGPAAPGVGVAPVDTARVMGSDSSAATPAAPAASVQDSGEIQRKAQRFAKLLVDEIKLYNQSKVAEGRANRDLYDRLKEDIEKSRETYARRYAQTSVIGMDYFTQELVRGLADNDPALLGSHFPR